MYRILEQLEGKKVTVILRSGQDMSGQLLLDHIDRDVNDRL